MQGSVRKSIGTSDFRKLRDVGGYFVDKSLFIKDLWEDAEVILFPRPRRFGKTLNLSMLRYFFEKSKEDRSYLFKDLKIWEYQEYQRLMGRFPVIFLTFKDVKFKSWKDAYSAIQQLISDLFKGFSFLLDSKIMSAEERQAFKRILRKEAPFSELVVSVYQLSGLLYRYYNEKVIILVDEYDVPIQAAFSRGYYDDMVDFMRGFLSAAFKDNSLLAKGVITGCLRLAKESIFTGMNNLVVYSMLSEYHATAFGFTEDEVKKLLEDTGLTDHADLIRQWYNGYIFGGKTLYNPWSILNYVAKYKDGPRPYWVNTSSNDLIKELVLDHGVGLKGDMEMLLTDRAIDKQIEENIVFRDLHANEDYVWSLMLFSGYLKTVDFRRQVRKWIASLKIPNEEVKYIFEDIFSNWLTQSVGSGRDTDMLIKAMIAGDAREFEIYLGRLMENSLSYFDTAKPQPEKVYHAFILGLLVHLTGRYEVRSNPETGFGRADVVLYPINKTDPGIIMELKTIDRVYEKTLDAAFEAAAKQVKAQDYVASLHARDVKKIITYLAVFDGKRVWVRQLDG